jgi:hypothetical protein
MRQKQNLNIIWHCGGWSNKKNVVEPQKQKTIAVDEKPAERWLGLCSRLQSESLLNE